MRRSAAIVRCAVDLGLRSGEIATLQLDDIDWREGTVTLRRTKSRREQVLPLPAQGGRRCSAAPFPQHNADLRQARRAQSQQRCTALARGIAAGAAAAATAGRAAVAGAPAMSASKSLSVLAQQYLRERRRLGFELHHMGQALHSFTRYADRLKRRPVTLELMAEWARRDHGHSTDPRTWARRLKILRPFMRWLQQFEPRTEIPDDTTFGPIGGRTAPHIYSEEETGQLLRAAGQLAPTLRGATYATLFGLLLCTGLRYWPFGPLRGADVNVSEGTGSRHWRLIDSPIFGHDPKRSTEPLILTAAGLW
jgi:integrase